MPGRRRCPLVRRPDKGGFTVIRKSDLHMNNALSDGRPDDEARKMDHVSIITLPNIQSLE